MAENHEMQSLHLAKLGITYHNEFADYHPQIQMIEMKENDNGTFSLWTIADEESPEATCLCGPSATIGQVEYAVAERIQETLGIIL